VKPVPTDLDLALVRRSQAGDRQAFAELVRRHQAGVYTLAMRLCGDADQAQDLAQEAFVTLFRKLGTFRGDSRFSTWFYTVVRNVCYRRYRSLPAELLASDGADEGTGPLEALPDQRPSPADIVEDRDDQVQTLTALAALPAKYRLVLTLFHVQAMGHDEIAAVLNLPLGTVKTHLVRGRQLLRLELVARGVLPS
jgi:RNA polymerase sigma-70 factor (ECF subfamily)